MPPTFQLKTAADYWLEMVVPDCSEYFANKDSMRYALHAAISLFHMSDWVFHTHETAVRANFKFKDRNGVIVPVSNEPRSRPHWNSSYRNLASFAASPMPPNI